MNEMKCEDLSLLSPFQAMSSSMVHCIQALRRNFREWRCTEHDTNGRHRDNKRTNDFKFLRLTLSSGRVSLSTKHVKDK